MLQEIFPSDIFGFISGIIVLVFVIAIIFFIIVILIVYKLLHTNVDNVKKKKVKIIEALNETSLPTSKENEKQEVNTIKEANLCKYCGQNVDQNISFCPYCGSNLTE